MLSFHLTTAKWWLAAARCGYDSWGSVQGRVMFFNGAIILGHVSETLGWDAVVPLPVLLRPSPPPTPIPFLVFQLLLTGKIHSHLSCDCNTGQKHRAPHTRVV